MGCLMLEGFIVAYGYPALALGAIVEGEVALVIAGFTAYLGYLNLPTAIVVSFIGSLLADQTYFYIGRRKGRQWMEKNPNFKKRASWVIGLFEKYDTWVLFLFRFASGFRAIIPITLGTSRVSAKKFAIFNIIGAAIWSTVFTLIGYFSGSAFSAILEDIRKYELVVVLAFVGLAVVLWVFVGIEKKKILNNLPLVDNKDMLI